MTQRPENERRRPDTEMLRRLPVDLLELLARGEAGDPALALAMLDSLRREPEKRRGGPHPARRRSAR